MEDLTGKTIERYKIVSELGRGGMAVVYRAIDTLLDRNVAIKVILMESDSKEKSQKILKRFNREARTLASLSHPNIIKVLDYGEYDGMPYIVMEFISGGALKAMLGSPIPYAEAAARLAPIARALQYAHQQKIVHRDVKPENILINESGQPMLSDFGILKLVETDESHGITGTGKMIGTPAYMSPEQIRGKEVDGRADLYSLGVVFFEMITGRKPYNALSPIELSMQHLHDPIPKAKQFVRDLPPEVEQAIVKSMAKNPEDRYQSLSVFAQDLEKLGGTTARTTGERRAVRTAEQTAPSSEKKTNYIPLFILAGVFVLLGVGTLLFGQKFFSPPAPATATHTIALSKTAAPTQTPAPTKPPPTPTRTKAPPTVTPTIEATSGTAIAIVIKPENASRVAEVNHVNSISVIKMDWTQNDENWFINVGTSSGSGIISFIDANDATIKHRIPMLTGEVPLAMAVSASNNRLYILVGSDIKVFDTKAYKLIGSYAVTKGTKSIAASPDGTLLALGIADNKVQLLNAENGSVVRTIRSNYGGWSVAFSPDSLLVSGGTSQGALLWEASSGLWLPTIGGENDTIKSLTFSNDGKLLAGGSNNVIYIWDVEQGSSLFQARGKFGQVNSLDFSPDNSILVSGADDGSVRLWSANGAQLKQLSGHTSPVFGVCFSPDGQKIASGANEGRILIWGIP